MNANQIYKQVQDHYGTAAQSKNTEYSHVVAKAFGYSEQELANIPKEANIGLSCGNPLAIASLRKGETIIDLGSGAGFDVFLAAKKVGPTGRVIGVDMNNEMLSRARKNAEKANATNVEFVESQITKIALNDGIADCIISNCVINLVPEEEKQLVFYEMFRLLKSGGRIAVSDILAKKPLSDEIRSSIVLYVSCIAGASSKDVYEGYLTEAGFRDVKIIDTMNDLNVYMEAGKDEMKRSSCCAPHKAKSNQPAKAQSAGCCSKRKEEAKPSYLDGLEKLRGLNLNEWVGSYKIFAVKP